MPERQPDGVQGACLWNQKARVWASALSFNHLTICLTNIYLVPTAAMYYASLKEKKYRAGREMDINVSLQGALGFKE